MCPWQTAECCETGIDKWQSGIFPAAVHAERKFFSSE